MKKRNWLKINEFKSKRIRLGLTPPELAEILEINVGKIFCYEEGTVSIPKVVELAIEALEKRLFKQNPITQNLPLIEISQVVEMARNAELRKDLDCLENIFGNLQSETVITFDQYPTDIHAELLRLYGFFLTSYGQAKNRKNYHAVAIDVLTRANKLFSEINDKPKMAETNVQIAFCYWNAGEVSNCEAFLRLSEFDFSEDKFHQVYLRIKISQMMLLGWLKRFPEALSIFNELSAVIKPNSDIRLKALFYIEAGIVLILTKRYKEAIFHLNEAVKVTRQNDNFLLLALTYNELSLLYLDLKVFGDAHLYSDKSLKILREDNQTGWIPHILDSKALILLEEENYGAALVKVEEALVYFYQGEDYKGLVGSLWTRILCFLRIGRAEDAIFAYGHLQQIAAERLGEDAAKRFAAEFGKEIYPLRNLPLDKEVNDLERTLISRALVKTNGGIVKAAELLKLKSHQALSYTLKQRHPNLYVNLGFSERVPRGSSDQKKIKPKNIIPRSIKIQSRQDFLRIDLQGKEILFGIELKTKNFKAFFFDEHLMSGFGIPDAAVVAVRKISKPKNGMPILVLHDNQITVANAIHDTELDLYLIYDEAGEPLFFEAENIIGEPIGYCLLDEIEEGSIKFSKL